MRFTVVLIPGSRAGRYVAHVPAIPGCTTQGDSIEEAIDMALDAATALLDDMADHDEDLPTESAGTVIASIEVALPISAEVAA